MHAGKMSLAALTLLLAAVLPAAAQFSNQNFGPSVHGVPPSVTSLNFGGQPGPHGLPASVTSLGFGDTFRFNQGFQFNQPFRSNHAFGFRHRRDFGFSRPFFSDIVAVPYAYPVYVMDPGVDDTMEEEYFGGPTIFDRRGYGPRYSEPQPREDREDYRARSEEPVPPAPQAAPESPAPEKPVPQEPTVLVFKDGHKSQVLNYAIVGGTLYDLSEGRTKKVALAELDLSATAKQNDERGVDFRIPAAVKAN